MAKVKHGFRNQVIAGRSDVDGYKRERDDFYPTPRRAVDALLLVEKFTDPIWEPACGDGAISKPFEEAGHTVISSDLVDRGFGESRIDFLMERTLRAPTIVTNPPFKLALPFAQHAVELGATKIALLLKIAFLEGTERGKFFRTNPPRKVWVFSQRLAFVPSGTIPARKLDGGGMMAFAWFVWQRNYQGDTMVGWV
ncbi:MAG: hypothetical protein KGL39_39850 [Patescibacteria group bacterium]|nr:hypothetical protein [Patescibacteria group bacterium]